MTRLLATVNLLGVLALAALCVVQWNRDRKVHDAYHQSEIARFSLEETVAQQKQQLKTSAADLDEFRSRLGQMAADLKETQGKLSSNETRVGQLESEREQLTLSLSNWVQAVKVRDDQLRTATTERNQLMTERNEIVAKFNELAERHSKLVKDWNDQQARLAAANRPPAEPPPATPKPSPR